MKTLLIIAAIAAIHLEKPITNEANMYPDLENYLKQALTDTANIPAERKEGLNELADFIQEQRDAKQPVQLTFICTHNSRRSHFGQVWAAVAAAHFGVDDGLTTFSGGTEATAFNPRAVAALQRAGLQVENPGGDNPKYTVRFANDKAALTCFSKKYDDASNPQGQFAAIMTCSDADRNCPIVPGAIARIAMPYNDPKAFDGTREEAAKYDERCRQIASEMLYVMSRVKP